MWVRRVGSLAEDTETSYGSIVERPASVDEGIMQ